MLSAFPLVEVGKFLRQFHVQLCMFMQTLILLLINYVVETIIIVIINAKPCLDVVLSTCLIFGIGH